MTTFEEIYEEEGGFVGWLSRDPLFRMCVLVETLLWVVFALFTSCVSCVLWRRCCFRRSTRYSPTAREELHRLDAFELKEKTGSSGESSFNIISDDLLGRRGAPSSSSSRDQSVCWKYKYLVSTVVGLILGFSFMIAALALAIPFLMPRLLYIPEPCDGAWCQRVPGAQSIFVQTRSGNNVSIRLFPAHKNGKYYFKQLSLMYSNPNAGYTTREPGVYEKLALFGINVYAWDYPGYMLSTGRPNYSSVLEAAETVLNFTAENSGVAPENVILLGRSLGGAVSTKLAQRFRSKALILLNALDSLRSLLSDCCVLSGWASGFYFRDQFDAAESLSNFQGCLFQYAAEKDTIVYFKRQKNLFFHLSENKRVNCSIFVEGKCMGHNDDQWQDDSFVGALNSYLKKL